MLTCEEREALGLPLEILQRRPSSVSQVLRAIRDGLSGGEPMWEEEATRAGETGYRIRVANDRSSRARAYGLAYAVYRGCGFIAEDARGLCLAPSDSRSETLTLLVEDLQGRAIATVSLVFDAAGGLPCDEIFGTEISGLREQGRRLVEVTRLAIASDHSASKMLLVRLFNFIYIFARKVKGCDDFVIEVNPRHVNYYRRLLGFEPTGPERPCPRVNDAPAVLLRLELSLPEREIRRVAGQGTAAGERSLYPYFYTWMEEGAIAELLARNQRAMTEDERRYFQLDSASAEPTQGVKTKDSDEKDEEKPQQSEELKRK